MNGFSGEVLDLLDKWFIGMQPLLFGLEWFLDNAVDGNVENHVLLSGKLVIVKKFVKGHDFVSGGTVVCGDERFIMSCITTICPSLIHVGPDDSNQASESFFTVLVLGFRTVRFEFVNSNPFRGESPIQDLTPTNLLLLLKNKMFVLRIKVGDSDVRGRPICYN